MEPAVKTRAEPINGLFSQVYRRMLKDQVQLPALPDVALRIRAAMQDPDYSVASVARSIQADAGTSAYLLRISNSALYRGVAKVSTVDAAVARLGVVTVRNLVTSYALRAMFTTRSSLLARLMRDRWARSARLAALAAVVAQKCGNFSRDRAMLAGLIQDIGMLPLIGALEARKQSLPDPERIVATLRQFSGKVGVVLLKHWNFDDELVDVAVTRGQWMRDSDAPADLSDLLIVARLHVMAVNPNRGDIPRVDEVPAFHKLPLGGVSDNAQLNILLEAETQVRELSQRLGV